MSGYNARSKEEKAIGLLTKAWPDQTLAFRRSLIPAISNQSLAGAELSAAVTASIQGLRSITTEPLEVADLIRAWGLMFPSLEEEGLIIAGVRNASIRHDRCSEAMLIGCFEVTNEPREDFDPGIPMLNFIEHHLSRQTWIAKECACTPQASGCLSLALDRFVQGLWARHPAMNRRLAKLADLVQRSMRSALDAPHDIPKVLHDHLINELLAKVFLQAPPAFRVFIIRDGLQPFLNRYLEMFDEAEA